MPFLQSLRELIAIKAAGLSDGEITIAKKIIDAAVRKKRKIEGLTMSGPCIFCNDHTAYQECDFHIRYGDDWLKKLRERIHRPARIEYRHEVGGWGWTLKRTDNSHGYSGGTARCFICDKCRAWADGWARGIREKEAVAQSERAALQQERHKEMVAAEAARKAAIAVLKTMPYREYLQSEHWKEVRSIILTRARHKCQLCFSSERLHVHHKTYEHRGEEQNHLGDLICLCEKCHEKFHDIGASA